MKKRIYIGCALTKLPPDKEKDFLQMLTDIKKGLKDHFEVLDFMGVNGGTPEEIYIHDIQKSVMTADCMLAICDYPSLGLGYELATAVEKKGISVLAIARKDAIVSKLIRGINHPNFKFTYYDSLQDILIQTIETLIPLEADRP